VDREATCAHVDFVNRTFVFAECNRVFAGTSASLRSKPTFARAEKQSRQSCPSEDHAQNADALGTGANNCPCEQSTGTARRLAENWRALARTPSRWQNQKLLHTSRSLPFAERDAKKSGTVGLH
jgi:hypothetical protein